MITCNKTNPPVKTIQQKLLWGRIAQDRFNDVNRKCHKMQVRNSLGQKRTEEYSTKKQSAEVSPQNGGIGQITTPHRARSHPHVSKLAAGIL